MAFQSYQGYCWPRWPFTSVSLRLLPSDPLQLFNHRRPIFIRQAVGIRDMEVVPQLGIQLPYPLPVFYTGSL
ncbi:MAG: hypothetical protein ACNA7V_06700 [Bacteroidales bacterium]